LEIVPVKPLRVSDATAPEAVIVGALLELVNVRATREVPVETVVENAAVLTVTAPGLVVVPARLKTVPVAVALMTAEPVVPKLTVAPDTDDSAEAVSTLPLISSEAPLVLSVMAPTVLKLLPSVTLELAELSVKGAPRATPLVLSVLVEAPTVIVPVQPVAVTPLAAMVNPPAPRDMLLALTNVSVPLEGAERLRLRMPVPTVRVAVYDEEDVELPNVTSSEAPGTDCPPVPFAVVAHFVP